MLCSSMAAFLAVRESEDRKEEKHDQQVFYE